MSARASIPTSNGQVSEPLLPAASLAYPALVPSSPKSPLHRIELAEKVIVSINNQWGVLVDISLSGALVKHVGAYEKGANVLLKFDWQGEQVKVECEVLRCAAFRSGPDRAFVSHSGIKFRRHFGNSQRTLRGMVTELGAGAR